MSIELKITRSAGPLRKRLERLGEQAGQALGEALVAEGERILADSKENYVPVRFNPLRNSGHVQPPTLIGREARVVLGFGGAAAPYAAAVHENPRAGKTGGYGPKGQKYKDYARTGQYKYLELPMQSASSGFTARIGQYLKSRWTA